MKVGELIEELSKLNPESQVILQKDSEGNGYSPLYCVDGEAIYISESLWYGKVYSTHYTADDNCMEEAEWEEIKTTHPRCVVLAPVN